MSKNVVFFLITFLLLSWLVLSFEFIGREYYLSKNPYAKSVRDLYLKYHNSFLNGYLTAGCHYAEGFSLDPTFGYSLKILPERHPCNFGGINDVNYRATYDFFSQVDRDDVYNVLVVGGSVAHDISTRVNENIPSVLERVLNNNLLPPKGEKFKVFSAATGGWAQPSQILNISRYGSLFDAVIQLDGYNEMISTSPESIDQTAVLWLINGFWGKQVLGKCLKKLVYFLKDNSFFGDSVIIYSLIDNVFSLFQKKVFNNSNVNFGQLNVLVNQQMNSSEKDNFSISKFFKYDEYAKALCEKKKIQYAHFVQPIRWLHKKLTLRESTYPEIIDVARYKKLLGEIKKRNNSIIDATDVFKNYHDEIYSDHIHFFRDLFSYDMRNGYFILADRISNDLRTRWSLKSR